MNDILNIPDPQSFWFISSELLMEVLRAEIRVVAHFLAEHPELPDWFDDPEIEIEHRKICFAVTARCSVMLNISDTIAARHEPSEALTNEESDTFWRATNLVASDAPAWTLEMNQIVERMPWHLSNALPATLRQQRFDEDSIEQASAIRAFSTVGQIQTFIRTVFDQQWKRLEGRWKQTMAAPLPTPTPLPTSRVKRKVRRTRDKLRMARDRMIAEIDELSPTVIEFLQLMDEREVKPQPTWIWPGSWKKAYKDSSLRALIHKDKSRAISRFKKQK
jgi:hypothetical protein